MTKQHSPECFGVFRSPQNDAENDCQCCPWDKVCSAVFITIHNAVLEERCACLDAVLSVNAWGYRDAVTAQLVKEAIANVIEERG